jgi:preprotein translocase subunit SecG
MVLFFIILIILACIILGFIILVQNPKGGGLAGNVAGFSNQLMGVKQTTDVLEKGTWILAIIVAVMCLFSAAFVPKSSSVRNQAPKVTAPVSPVNPNSQQQTPVTVPQK